MLVHSIGNAGDAIMANTIQPKKLLIVNIIDILYKYTDENHTLTQREIEKILETEYMMKVDRKAVHRNLMDLIDSDAVELQYTEKPRTIKNPKTGELEETSVYTDFSIVRDFTEGELRYLIDGVFASRHIPAKHREQLIKKLEEIGGKYFKSHAGNITKEAPLAVYTKGVFFNIQQLDTAIREHKKVRFHYKGFDLDKKPMYRLDKDGNPKVYTISPYEMVAKNGQYYLICSDEKHNDLSNYRVDRIADVEILDERVRPLKDFASKADMDRYMKEHIYMYAGKGVKAKFKIRRRMIADVIDTFGTDFYVSDVDEDENNGWMTVSASVNADSLVVYAKSLAPDVVVLSPKEVVDRVKSELELTLKMYEEAL